MMPYMLRSAKAKDALELIEMINEIAGESEYHTFSQGEYDRSIEEQTMIINSMNTIENSLFIVAANSKELIGMLTISGGNSIKSKHRGDLGIILRKKYWHKGIGTSMMEQALEWSFTNSHLKKLNLLVHEDNSRAIELYDRLGFIKEGKSVMHFCTDEKYADGIYMGLVV